MLIKLPRSAKTKTVNNAKALHAVLCSILYSKHRFDYEKEHFYVILLSRSYKIKYVDEVSIGNLNSTIVSAREVFRFAILKGADSIIIAHNHPSGNMTASAQDRETTKTIVAAGKVIGINVLDSMIFCKSAYYSFTEEGVL